MLDLFTSKATLTYLDEEDTPAAKTLALQRPLRTLLHSSGSSAFRALLSAQLLSLFDAWIWRCGYTLFAGDNSKVRLKNDEGCNGAQGEEDKSCPVVQYLQ